MNCCIQSFLLIGLLFSLDVPNCETRYLSFLRARAKSKRNADLKCTLAPHPRNGQWKVLVVPGPSDNADSLLRQPGQEIIQNTIVEYKCNSGYKLSSSIKYVVCDPGWNQTELPTCLKLCPPLFSTATTLLKCKDMYGREISCGEAAHGTYLTYDCIAYYEAPSGYGRTLTCIDGQWRYNNTVCPSGLCSPLSSSATTILTCTDMNKREISCGEAARGTYLSYDGIAHYKTPRGDRKTLACIDGQWRYNTPVCQPVCGRKVGKVKIILTASVGATELREIEYPWLVAIYQKIDYDFINVCGGTIISRKVVLTAAHCVTNEYGNRYPAENFRIGVGKLYNKYQDPRENLSIYYEVREVIPYHIYNGEGRRYIGDIAIVVSKQLFKWGPVVQPVCMSNIERIPLTVGSIGEIAGWGVKEDGDSADKLRFLRIPYKNERQCTSELPAEWESKYNMEDKLCAGFHERNISVCKGDSGNGLVFKNPEDNRFYLHGIVSLGPSLKGECNIRQNTLYTKVAYYSEFIDRQINKNYEEQCILPSYPANGKYVVDNDESKIPGNIVSTSSVLKVECNEGYALVPPVTTVECENGLHMPKCLLVCSLPELPNVASYECVNQEAEFVNCSRALTGTILKFTCSPGFAVISGTSTLRSCRNGSWGSPNPGCGSIALTESVPVTEKTTSSTPISENMKTS